jgi:glutaredoxin
MKKEIIKTQITIPAYECPYCHKVEQYDSSIKECMFKHEWDEMKKEVQYCMETVIVESEEQLERYCSMMQRSYRGNWRIEYVWSGPGRYNHGSYYTIEEANPYDYDSERLTGLRYTKSW